MSNSYIAALKKRRTQYALGKNLPLSQDATAELIREAIKHSPSSFNSQSSRAIILSAKRATSSGTSPRKHSTRSFLLTRLHKLKPSLTALLQVPVRYFSLKTRMSLRACRKTLHSMQTISLSGQNRLVAWHSFRFGRHLPMKISAQAFSTIIP